MEVRYERGVNLPPARLTGNRKAVGKKDVTGRKSQTKRIVPDYAGKIGNRNRTASCNSSPPLRPDPLTFRRLSPWVKP